MKLKAVRIICTLLIASVLSTGIIALPVQNAFAEDSIQIESVDTVPSGTADVYSTPVQNPSKFGWRKESNGRWWYCHPDGSYTKYDWEYIDGSWYFFDSNGWMWTGWLKWEGSWYYLNPSGVMHTGWLKDDGKWYYFTMRGIMQTGWIKLDADWYYLGTDGVMQTGWKKINGSWYYFKSNGVMNTNTFYQNQREYQFLSSGKLFATRIYDIHQTQQKSNWCWAACSSMVGTYNTNSTVTQKQIVSRYYKDENDNNRGGSPLMISLSILFASNNTKETSFHQSFTYTEAVNTIDDNHPFVLNTHISVEDKTTNEVRQYAHAMVCAGYKLTDSKIYIDDPENRLTGFYNYNPLFTNGLKIDNKTITCSLIITAKFKEEQQ